MTDYRWRQGLHYTRWRARGTAAREAQRQADNDDHRKKMGQHKAATIAVQGASS